MVQHEKYGFFWSRVLYPLAKQNRSQPRAEFAVVEPFRLVSSGCSYIPKLDGSLRLRKSLFLPYESWLEKFALVVGNVPFEPGVWRERGARSTDGNYFTDQFGKEVSKEELPDCMPIGPSATDHVRFLALVQEAYEEDPESFIRIE